MMSAILSYLNSARMVVRRRRPRKGGNGPRRVGVLPCRPKCEPLEDRTLLSIVSWDGGGGNFDWHNALNWSNDSLPGVSDDVLIGSAFNGITISSASDATIRSVTSEASLQIAGGTFSIAAASFVRNALHNAGTVAVRRGPIWN